jgi:hypothetical protein
VTQRRAIANGDMTVQPYREIVTGARLGNAEAIPAIAGTIGGVFDIFYGMKELHSREGIAPGRSLVISPTEEYNGCYGWLEYPTLIAPPFVTVAQTGSIGEAFVQLEPCAVNDDCLILLPKQGIEITMSALVLAAACLQSEKWRFTYGRKLTPSRIAAFPMPQSKAIDEWVTGKLDDIDGVISAGLFPYETDDERDADIARRRLAEIKEHPEKLVHGDELSERLERIET